MKEYLVSLDMVVRCARTVMAENENDARRQFCKLPEFHNGKLVPSDATIVECDHDISFHIVEDE